MNESDFVNPDLVFRMGKTPSQIDVLTRIDGVAFDDAWQRRLIHEVQGVKVPIISVRDQIQNKRSTSRPKDRSTLIGPKRIAFQKAKSTP